MGNITLVDSLLSIVSFSTRVKTQAYRTQSASLINLSTTNGASRLQIKMTLASLNKYQKDYLEGTILAAAYNFDTITFTLPQEYYYYFGPATTIPEVRTGPLVAGSNNVNLVKGGLSSYPTADDVRTGMMFNVGNDTTLYRVNAYNATTGNVVFFPALRNSVTVGDVMDLRTPKITAHIMKDPQSTYLHSNYNYVSYKFDLEESL